MDATLSNYRKRMFPVVLALSVSVGISLSHCSWSAELEANPARSARGSVAFVPKTKPAAKTNRGTSPAVSRLETRTQVSSRLPASTPGPQSAQGDLVLIPQHQLAPSLYRSLSSTALSSTRDVAQAQRAQRYQTAKPTGTHRLVDAMQIRNTKQVAPADHVVVAQYQEEVDSPDPIGKLLIEAHTISLHAVTEADYSKIIEGSTTAIRQGAQQADQRFAHRLASWALNRRGQLRVTQGQQELADADFRAALDHYANNWRALHNRGVSLAQQGSFAEAFDDFNRVIQLNPKYAKAFVNRATLFMQANDLQSALEDYQYAAKIDPEFATAQLGIGRVEHMLGNWDKALTFFEAAVQLDPTNAEILCSRGDLLADMGQYGKALAGYARAIEADPQFAHAYRNGSWLLATCPDPQFRDPENALLGARQALEFDYGQRHVALDTLAAALASTGQYDKAISTLQNALAIAPAASKPAYTQRLRLYQHQQPFRTEPIGEVSQVVFEVSDR